MNTLNTNDYFILNKIVDVDNNLGSSKLRGITVVEIAETTNLSTTKVRNSIKKLIEAGFVDNAIKRVKSHTYHITEKGIQEIENVKINYLEEEIIDGD